MTMDDEIMKLDLYEIIGTTITADESEIKKAYRKKALSCHPDKNPNNPKAAELFLQLTRALEILTDVAARAAYDKVINARAQAKARVKELDAKRRKFKDELEAREEAFKKSQTTDYASAKSDEDKLKAEIERLKKEGSRLVEEEKIRLKQKIIDDLRNENSGNCYSEDECRVKIKWKVAADDVNNGGYDYDNLHRFLSKHGDISVLVLSTAKKGRALVEYTSGKAAQSAVNYEKGLVTNPLKLEGVWEKNKTKHKTYINTNTLFTGINLFPSAEGSMNTNRNHVSQGLSFSSAPDIFNTRSNNDSDLETIILNNLRRAEERKKLIEQMQAEDEGT
ncbi:PREDICTED: dnaJ homolog subfamily C member 17 [Ceratosolen solmsi marchali]|uniref:DnaJ homolog subfamily C member 17 n=1 Tax=Ceratosolen solmsi marchali TaxID=326594 RepID=A0AAJ7DW71_9HYME|nr:PREDICTED: dnaJ homolog subfamily C member 17 [Ceratosolen solmsi marchali]XP_011498661.1 PREDICTED: dnaJ homolog subfamily C member 17 [Ceratosolen solmsi marchali]